MPSYYTTIGPWTFQTFSLVITLAVLLSTGLSLWRSGYAGALADVYLGGLVGAVLVGRLFHVLLNWNYFAENVNEAAQISLGGLDWHGAVIGGVAGLWLLYRIRFWMNRQCSSASGYPPFSVLLDSLAPLLALLGVAGWYACLAGLCGYGREVATLADYPAWAVAETADVFGIAAPRFNTQLFGMAWSALVVLIALLLRRRGRFGLVLVLLSAGYFVIGFFRGDYALLMAGLRAEQWLDLAVMGSVAALAVSKKLFSVYIARSKHVIG